MYSRFIRGFVGLSKVLLGTTACLAAVSVVSYAGTIDSFNLAVYLIFRLDGVWILQY
jgi:hypothetical protein